MHQGGGFPGHGGMPGAPHGLPPHLAGMSGQLAGLAGLSGSAAMQAMAAMGQLGQMGGMGGLVGQAGAVGLGPGQNNVPPPPGLGSGLLALGSVAGALVGGQNNYNQEQKENDRTVSYYRNKRSI
jgi:hypothetical protein